MSTSRFNWWRAYMDYKNPDTPYPFDFYVGSYYLGGQKQVDYRAIARYDLAVPASGPAVGAGDLLISARLDCMVTNTNGPFSWPCALDRVTRYGWDYLTQTWNVYATGQAWTSTGGDVDVPPPSLAYTSPAAAGAPFTINGLLPFVQDAIANRAGIVLIRHKAVDETLSQWFRLNSAVLVVEHAGAQETPISEPVHSRLATPAVAGAARAARPARAVQPTKGART